jgi:hypothetical protein
MAKKPKKAIEDDIIVPLTAAANLAVKAKAAIGKLYDNDSSNETLGMIYHQMSLAIMHLNDAKANMSKVLFSG